MFVLRLVLIYSLFFVLVRTSTLILVLKCCQPAYLLSSGLYSPTGGKGWFSLSTKIGGLRNNRSKDITKVNSPLLSPSP